MNNKKIKWALLLVLLGVIGYASSSIITENNEQINMKVSNTAEESEIVTAPKDKKLVYITGAVEKPGLYEVSTGASVEDVVKSSGGLLPFAGVESINLADDVKSGEHIHIPFNFTGAKEELLRKPLLNINTASVEELDALPGVGPALAKRIDEYRKKEGSFKQIEDLKKVKGIGDAMYQKVADRITI